jgi:polyhydroxyalkanoate synthesis regulator phasin
MSEWETLIKRVTANRGSLDARMSAMQEMIRELERTLVTEMAALRDEIRDLRARLNGPK